MIGKLWCRRGEILLWVLLGPNSGNFIGEGSPGQPSARPTAPEVPVSASALALGRGGGSALEGVSGLLHNPATLFWTGGAQVESGLIGLSEGLSPYALMGYQIPEGSTGALGGFRYATEEGYAYQGLVAGFSWPLGEDARLGMGITGAFAEGDFGADGHAGFWMLLGEYVQSGLWVRNAMASGLGQKPDGFETEREAGFALGLARHTLSLWRLHLHDLGLSYDLTSHHWAPQDWRHALAGQIWLPPGGSLGLLLGAALEGHDPMPQMSYGLGLKLPLAGGALGLIYALSPGETPGEDAKGGGSGGLRQSLALKYEVGKQVDVLAPRVSLVAMPSRMPLDSIAEIGLYFQLTAEDPDGQLATWELALMPTDATGKVGAALMRYEGKELPPRLIRWSGEDGQGKRLPPGLYAYRFTATDKAGNKATAPLGLVELLPVQP